MKRNKHLTLNTYKALILSGIRFLATLTLFLFVSSFPAKAISSQETTTPKSFADWCLNQHKESVATQHTIDVLLQVAQTQALDILD
jgi:hypothetical protein